ncbi:MAG: acyl--CoA ligase [Gammaproteobacteria bacterium]|nr:acyl--CoA ligase [Gammaproteobacteria bacterium]
MANSLVELLLNSVEKYPEKEVVAHKDRRVSYSRLWEDACRVAGYLRDQNINREDRVGILIENSPEYIAMYYGVLIAGGAAVGLNSGAKARDLVNWLRHSGAKWLFAQGSHPELAEVIKALGKEITVVCVGAPDAQLDASTYVKWEDSIGRTEPSNSIGNITNSNQVAAIIYTSGTTGKPKGVTLSHRNLVANTLSIISYLELQETDRILNVLPFHYSYGNSVLHTHLAVGGSLVLENSLMYPQKILQKMQSEKVTGFSGVPSTYALLLSRTNLKEYDLSSIRYMTQAGGPMAPASVERFTRELPHVRFFVMYGQTEATARLTWLPPEKLVEKLGSIGIPIPGVKIRICDEHDRPVESGVTGEIQVQGGNVMLGYWRDEETTRTVLKDNWLHTGDLAHQDDDGYIYIDGRSSDMIKTGANRVSPKEIEEVILELEGMEEVAAVGIPDEILGQVIKVVVVLSPGVDLSKRAIQAHCHKNLASYKIPKFIEFVSQLPKTSSGKVQRFLLQTESLKN